MAAVPDPKEGVDYLPIDIDFVDYELDGNKVHLSHSQLQQFLRVRFFDQIQTRRLFENTVRGTLRPAWKALPPDLQAITSVRRLPECDYARKLAVFVADTLKCRENGGPAAWLGQLIHEYVLGVPGIRGAHVGEPDIKVIHRAIVYVEAPTSGTAGVVSFVADQGSLKTTNLDVPSNGYGAFDEWKDLRNRARAVLDAALVDLEQEFKRNTKTTFKGTLVDRLNNIKDTDLKEVADYLINGTISETRKRHLRRVIADMGLDPIGRKTAKKRGQK